MLNFMSCSLLNDCGLTTPFACGKCFPRDTDENNAILGAIHQRKWDGSLAKITAPPKSIRSKVNNAKILRDFCSIMHTQSAAYKLRNRYIVHANGRVLKQTMRPNKYGMNLLNK